MRVLVVDDQAAIRQLLTRLLRASDDCEIVGEAENGSIAVREVRRLKPDAVILDLDMPVMGGLEAASQIKQICPDARLVIHSGRLTPEAAAVLEALGVEDMVEKGDRQGLLDALRH